jgi:hypothetical protein
VIARVLICALAVLAYVIWAAIYLLPYTRDEVFSGANLRRAFHSAIRY